MPDALAFSIREATVRLIDAFRSRERSTPRFGIISPAEFERH